MTAIVKKELCVGCGACVDVCSVEASTIEDGIAVINEKCI